MTLYLVESDLNGRIDDAQSFRTLTDTLKGRLSDRSARLLEVQVSSAFERAFFIAEGSEEDLRDSLAEADIEATLLKEVRLIGQSSEDAEQAGQGVNYIVEWNLPAELTMDRYLERKRNNSVHYAKVPEVAFSRTYVCEDMTKCLCFYKAPDEAAVKRAREAVNAPVDAITEIASQE